MGMTNKDIVVTILSELTGKGVNEVRAKFSRLLCTPKMEQELPDDEASKLLEELRAEKAGILNWALEGLKRANAQSN
jgi:hypothetical protein